MKTKIDSQPITRANQIQKAERQAQTFTIDFIKTFFLRAISKQWLIINVCVSCYSGTKKDFIILRLAMTFFLIMRVNLSLFSYASLPQTQRS
jgi:hypothetical protein